MDNDDRFDLTSFEPSRRSWRSDSLIVKSSFGLILRIAGVGSLCALLLVVLCLGTGRCEESDVDWAAYARAVEFCRGGVARPMSLSSDKKILCFDGRINSGQDVSLANDLADEGLFVVRSFGGHVATAIALANLLRDRRAIVVIYDYCTSACAGYLFIASARTFVMKGSLVAWHHWATAIQFDCPRVAVAKDGGPKRVERSICPGLNPDPLGGYGQALALSNRFYFERVTDKTFEFPPESFTVRRILKNMFEGTGTYPDVAWTWNPRYYETKIRTKVVYEAYPESQDDVDEMVNRLPLRHVIYDP